MSADASLSGPDTALLHTRGDCQFNDCQLYRQLFQIITIIVYDYAVVKDVRHLGRDEVMEAGDREFDPRPGHCSRMNF